MTEFMKSNKALDSDIMKANTPEEIRALLENAISRSGIADRDPVSGQFIRRDPLTPVQQTAAPEAETQITKTEVIAGKEFTFQGTEAEVEKQVADAYRVAEAVKAAEPPALVTPRSGRVKTQAEQEQKVFDRAGLELRFKRGEITAADYIEQSGAVDDYLTKRGFDLEAAAGKQFEQSWQQATETFLRDTPEGRDWKRGEKNKELIGNLLVSHNLMDAPDKVAALRAMAKEMREKGLEFDSDYTPEQMNQMTNGMSPAEILEHWKASHPDAKTANEAFIALNGGSGGLFDRG